MINAFEEHISELQNILQRYKSGTVNIGSLDRSFTSDKPTGLNIFNEPVGPEEPVKKLQISIEYVSVGKI